MDKKNSSLKSEVVVGRIRQLLVESNHTEREFVEYLGIGAETFNNWKRNRSDSYLHYLKEISEYFHVTPNYLILGDDDMSGVHKEELSKDELELVDMFRRIGMNEKRYVKILMQGMLT